MVTEFARYLFDLPVDLVLEAQTPEDGSRLDLLVPNFGNTRLIVEANVFDGTGRNANHIIAGLPQAAE